MEKLTAGASALAEITVSVFVVVAVPGPLFAEHAPRNAAISATNDSPGITRFMKISPKIDSTCEHAQFHPAIAFTVPIAVLRIDQEL
jgi:hypothetical protein